MICVLQALIGFAATGGSQRKLSFVDCRRFETRPAAKWESDSSDSMGGKNWTRCQNPWKLLGVKGFMVRSSRIPNSIGRHSDAQPVRSPNMLVCQCSKEKLSKKHTLSWALSSFRHPYMMVEHTAVRDPVPMWCISWSEVKQKGLGQNVRPHIFPGAVPSKKIDKFSTT